MLSQKIVKKLFTYDSISGNLIWKITTRNTKQGDCAGCRNTQGYIVIRFKGKNYYAHRLIWLLCKGYFPENSIDHINRDPSDNRLDNLREVSHQCNMRNVATRKNSVSGVRGVYWFKRTNKWQSAIRINNTNYHLGYYSNLDEAVAHRLAAEQCVDWSGCDSSSPAYQHMQKVLNNVD